MNEKQKEKTLTCRVPAELADRLSAVAQRTRRTKSFFLRQLLVDSIEDLEDLADSIEAIERGGPRWSSEELRAELEDEARRQERAVAN